MSKLVFDDVRIDLKGRQLLRVDQTVAAGDVLTVMGPSGSGKSTLLAYMGGFLDNVFSASGAVMLNGSDIIQMPAHERRTGILFQDPLLFPHMSVGENLLFAVPRETMGAKRRAVAEEALRDVELDGFFDRDPETLSGGQKARVALVRVLLSKPSALLLDEPFSKLDTQLRDQSRKLVFDVARRENLPTVLVTHDEADAEAAGGKIIRLD